MSATIKLDIIKALVEHIGMDPNSIETNPTFLNATWEINDINEFTFTLPEGQTLDIGSAIKITAEDGSKTLVMYCVNKTTSDGITIYETRNLEDLKARMSIGLENGVYITRIKATYVKTPDNKTTGIYNTTNDDIIKLIMEIIRTPTFSTGNGIEITNNTIGVKYDGNTMELKDGKISAKTQLTAGNGIEISNDVIGVKYDGNTMELKDGKISAKTQLTAGNGIEISNDVIGVKYDGNTMELKDGKLAVKASDNGLPLTTDSYRANLKYRLISGSLAIPAETPGQIPIGSIIKTYYAGIGKSTYIITGTFLSKNGITDYYFRNILGGGDKMLIYVEGSKEYQCLTLFHSGDITEEYGLFYRGFGQLSTPNVIEVVPALEYYTMINALNNRITALESK